MSIIQQYNSNLKANYYFNRGDLVDNSGTISGSLTPSGTPTWSRSPRGHAVKFRKTTDYFTAGSDSQAALRSVNATGIFTIFSVVRFNSSGNQMWLGNSNTFGLAGFYLLRSNSSGNVTIRRYANDGLNQLASTLAVVPPTDTRWHYIAVIGDGSTIDFFIDGFYEQPGGAQSQFEDIDAEQALTFNRAQSATSASQTDQSRFIFFDTNLSRNEIYQLYAELKAEQAEIQGIQRSFESPELLAYSSFQKDAIYTKGTGWTISKGKASCDGSQVSNSDLTQDVATVGNAYTIQFSLSNYSAGNVAALAGTTAGTNRTANGVYTEYLTQAGSGVVGLRADSDFVGDIDWIKVSKGHKINFKCDFKGAVESINGTGVAGPIAGWQVKNDTMYITNDGTYKWLERASGTTAVAGTLCDGAYGTWRLRLENSTGSDYFIFSQDEIGKHTEIQSCYTLELTTNNALLRKTVAGSDSTIKTGSGLTISDSVEYDIVITRTQAGVITVYGKGGAYSSYTQWLTVTDTSITSGHFITFWGANKITNLIHFMGVVDYSNFENL